NMAFLSSASRVAGSDSAAVRRRPCTGTTGGISTLLGEFAAQPGAPVSAAATSPRLGRPNGPRGRPAAARRAESGGGVSPRTGLGAVGGPSGRGGRGAGPAVADGAGKG